MRTWIRLIGRFHIVWKLQIINQREQKPLHQHLIMGEHLASSTHGILIGVFLLRHVSVRICLCVYRADVCYLQFRLITSLRLITESKTCLRHVSDIWSHFSKSNYLIIMEGEGSVWTIKNSSADICVSDIWKCRLIEGHDVFITHTLIKHIKKVMFGC